MKAIAFDTETYLIQACDKAPKPVCCTWNEGGDSFITRPDDAATWALWNDPERVFFGVNMPYDLVVMMRWHPQYIPAIVRALDEGRVIDLPLRHGLIYLATKGGLGYQPEKISLAYLAKEYLGLDLSANKVGDDIWRLKFGTLDGVPFNLWPVDALTYALDDAKHTYNLGMMLGDPFKLYPTEEAQNQAAVALTCTSTWGFKVNQQIRGSLKEILCRQIHELTEKTKHLRWTGEGSQARLGAAVTAAWETKTLKGIAQYAAMTGVYIDVQRLTARVNILGLRTEIERWINELLLPEGLPVQFPQGRDPLMWFRELYDVLPEIPMTTKGPSAAEECLELIKDEMPDARPYLDLKHKIKMVSTYIDSYPRETAHPRFVPMVSTGRTGCRGDHSKKGNDGSSGQTQNIPRKDKDRPEEAFRTMFMARPGRVLGTVDYSQLELCTLAATIRTFFPQVQCTMGDAIDNNIDVHCVTGSQILNVPYEQMLKNKKVAGSQEAEARQASKACFSHDTELLTRKGWVPICTLATFDRDAEIMQYCPHKKRLSFVRSAGWVIKEADTLVHLQGSFMDQMVTPDHRLLFINKTAGTVAEVLAEKAASVAESSLSVHGGVFDNTKEKKYSDIITRLAVMVQADGNYFTNDTVRLGFTKQRKIDRCRVLLDKAGMDYEFKLVGTAQVPTFYVHNRHQWCALDDKKSFLPWYVYDLSAFVDELFRWDGTVIKKHTNSYFNTKRCDVECAQTVLACANRKSAIAIEPGQEENHQDMHTLNWYNGSSKGNPAYCRSSGLSVSEVKGKFFVYCPSVPTSWVLTRRNGKVAVSGNCNFGYPGGLGAQSFVGYAKSQYGVDLTVQDAYRFKGIWQQTWPEMKIYLADAKNTVGSSPGGRAMAFTINQFTKANCFYTELANFRFQSLAAEGAKRAMWAIQREILLGWYWSRVSGRGYGSEVRDGALKDSRLVNFVHDEIVAEHVEGDAGKAAMKRQEQLMVDVMTRTCQNKITIRVEGALSHQWEH